MKQIASKRIMDKTKRISVTLGNWEYKELLRITKKSKRSVDREAGIAISLYINQHIQASR